MSGELLELSSGFNSYRQNLITDGGDSLLLLQSYSVTGESISGFVFEIYITFP
jgi:hypothetical protein